MIAIDVKRTLYLVDSRGNNHACIRRCLVVPATLLATRCGRLWRRRWQWRRRIGKGGWGCWRVHSAEKIGESQGENEKITLLR